MFYITVMKTEHYLSKKNLQVCLCVIGCLLPMFPEVHVYNLMTSRRFDIWNVSDSKSTTSQHLIVPSQQ